jgi:hypothetical protein
MDRWWGFMDLWWRFCSFFPRYYWYWYLRISLFIYLAG